MSKKIVESLYRISGITLNENSDSTFEFTGMSSEHKDVLEKDYGLPYEEAHALIELTGSRYFTYAWLDTPQYKELPIAVVDYHAKQLKFKKYQRPWAVSSPVWSWIADERTPEQQKFIDEHIDEIDKAFKEYIINTGF